MAVITDISQLDLSKSYTYADTLDWHFKEYVELIGGRVFAKPTPLTMHQQCLGNLAGEIGRYCKHRPFQAWMGPLDVRLAAARLADSQITTVVQPDLFVLHDRRKMDRRGCVGAPDWIIEIISPGTAIHDTKTKFDLYAENEVREYWIVYPGEQTISVYVLREGEYQPQADYYEPGLIPSHTLPELQLEWADVFEGVA
ncbi:MAG: Uma2 family endonuclease [Hymenobacter sp.]|nr:MAG: Uma2 family endonuclease [Hymenobacter sp.]